jgi:murein DD-endopeptidase MepM/ murein hydrolase activator NlpD
MSPTTCQKDGPAPRATRVRPRAGLWLAAGAIVVTGLVGSACGADNSSAGSTARTATAIQVPDAFTAVVAHPISAPTFPFLGTDGKYHISYDLQLTNASRLPATIDKVDVIDANTRTTVLTSLTGTRLVDPNCPIGDCNRLRRLPSAPSESNVIPPQESRVLMIDFAVDSLDNAPKAVLHHLYAQASSNPGAAEPTAVDYLFAPFDTSSGKPRVIGPPVKGDHWVALNGCCDIGFPHRTSTATFNGLLVNGQRFAIDWKRMDDSGRFYEGDKTKNESYIDYGDDIIAAADGTITATLDRMDANAPGVLPANDPVLSKQLTVETVDGNHIVEDIGGGVFAFYAHLQKGSLLVNPGDKVKKGQVIAKLGNTGNANASHMHFHLMNGPSVLGSDGVPYVIDRFDYDGQVAPQTLLDADDFLSGVFNQGQLPTADPRRAELPMSLAIVNFPGWPRVGGSADH